MAPSTQQRLAGYQRRYRELAAELADLGYIAAGSITQRSTRCGTPSCRCHADPPQLHGPYWQWTAKVNGKTVTRRLSQTDAKLYQEWISNDRQLRKTITKMRQLAAKASELMITKANKAQGLIASSVASTLRFRDGRMEGRSHCGRGCLSLFCFETPAGRDALAY